MSMTLADMTAEIREVNVAKGWRVAEGGPGTNTWGDYMALLHSEITEALEAYRTWKLDDATATGCLRCTMSGVGACDDAPHVFKPEGVGSELADVLIRFLDMCDVFGLTPFDMDMELADVAALVLAEDAFPGKTFGDHMAWLHREAVNVDVAGRASGFAAVLPRFLRALVAVADWYGIRLDAEYRRKVDFNRTRDFQHGGRTL